MSINIEEERIAFESWYTKEYGTPVSVLMILRLQETYSIAANENVRRAWISWLAAKQHAAEMSKPGCILTKVDGLFQLRISWRREDFIKFRTEDEARSWACDKGYRVIEE